MLPLHTLASLGIDCHPVFLEDAPISYPLKDSEDPASAPQSPSLCVKVATPDVASQSQRQSQKQKQKQIDGERSMLELLVGRAPLPEILNAFTRIFDANFAGMMCSILLLDEDGLHLRHGDAPSLPGAFWQALDGTPIGMDAGSCAAAAYLAKETLVSDLAVDPLWKDYRELALSHGLQACWSIPLISTKAKVLGTFAVYHASPRSPQPGELQAIRRVAYLAGLAIEQHLAEQQLISGQDSLRESALHGQTILDNMVDGVITINAQGLMESFNKAASTIFGYDAQEILGHNVSMLMAEPYRSKYAGDLHHYKSTREVKGQRKNGVAFPLSLSISEISRAGQLTFIAIARDITQHHQDLEEIRRLAFYDSLTGLPNRRLLMDRLKLAMTTSQRTGQHGAVIFLDLDHFKLINDRLGHDLGDVLLQQVAIRLQASVCECGSVARLGGDEFVVLLEVLSMREHEAAAQTNVIADKILVALGQPYNLLGHTYHSTPSMGLLVFMGVRETMDELFKKADLAMYQAKAAGRNTSRFCDPAMHAAAAAHAELEKDMHRGLTQREFLLHYQIQVNSLGMPVGAEALVRWNHATRGLLSPACFISLAEETGMILLLGQWVLETACAQLVTWASDPKTAPWTMAVNVSALQFSQADYVATVLDALHKTGANPRLLKLELTETMLVDDVESIILKMNTIMAAGVGMSLDDFGTGYSSLSYLKRLPLDQLKIDRSFVRDVLTDGNDAAIASTVVALGHSLGLKVIAEGVETADQRDFLAGIGCDAFQGFYFGHPVPACELA
jgi:diguanylate cyclase (GGDEF)-like protein/PAS domain S-box-containing protein